MVAQVTPSSALLSRDTSTALSLVASNLLTDCTQLDAVSSLVQAVRQLFGNLGTAPVPDIWTMQNPILASLIGITVMLLVFVPLCIRKFARISSR